MAVQNIYQAGALAADAAAIAGLPANRIASLGAGLGFAETVAEKIAGDGSAASETWTARKDGRGHAGDRHKTAAGWIAIGLRAEGISFAGECGDSASSGSRRM